MMARKPNQVGLDDDNSAEEARHPLPWHNAGGPDGAGSAASAGTAPIPDQAGLRDCHFVSADCLSKLAMR